MIDRSLDFFLERMPISEDIKQALLGRPSPFGDVYRIVLSYEQAAWGKITLLAANLQLELTDLPHLYVKAIERSNQFLLG